MALNSIVVNDSGTLFMYTDTGTPSQSQYTTIVAIHGMGFSGGVFKKVQKVALEKGVRFVALNRRNYPGSTPYSQEDINMLVKGTKEQKDDWHRDRGHELGMFIHKLIDKGNLPPISADRKTGGIIVVGWSAGAGDAIGTIAHAETLPAEVRTRLKLCIRSLIIQDSHRGMFGSPLEPTFYTPSLDNRVPPEDRFEKFCYWVSCYFQHGDISTRNPDVLSWVDPSTIRPATFENMTADEKKNIVCPGEAPKYDVLYMRGLLEQFADAYRKAFFGDSVKKLFPGFKVSFLAGDLSPAHAISTYWTLENDIKETGKPVNLTLISGSNHFLHWDNPEEALRVYLECS